MTATRRPSRAARTGALRTCARREREGRRLPDAVVASLPDVPASHPLSHEWRQRADLRARLVAYLRALPGPMTVVDVGCGNGWLANRIAGIDATRVVGVDAIPEEVDQARRVFGGHPRLEFVQAEVVDGHLPADRPDVVVLASVIQYLPDPAGRRLGARVAALGRRGPRPRQPAHRPAELAAARERTREHYGEVGAPEMARAYHHHCWETFALAPLRGPVPARRRPGAGSSAACCDARGRPSRGSGSAPRTGARAT